MLIDAHCHLDFEAFDEDRKAMFSRAHEAGVEHFLVPGTTRRRWPDVIDVAQRSDVSLSLGLHPYFMHEHGTEDIEALERALDDHPEVIALGECGIDARFEDTLDDQWALFEEQLRIAKARRLPVVIHCVHANDKVSKRLRQLDLPAGGLIHAFAGSPEQAGKFIDLGFVVGLGGATTYERAKRVHRAVAALPDHGFVLETDSPDMPLCGFQGQRNEPARIAMVCRQVAELRGQTDEEVAEHTTANVQRVFGITPHAS
ncbi:TatD family hydrolase [Halomonas sp. McH1-25]|uniref:TatD family hydrolase n=1 Tax=unclassified Halomonas TaxID=2609666 RepID=UPI001EF40C7F|nr:MULTISPECIES: TatD family hydrolase [unclassified Halomonas]MCG7598523.1 TatD family hydrolase [Halomonas sp. McH1-25]MCP1341775.1 TatD family hydrolase [Halomonas sp. FL8]MCP1360992.1 TatD family hydrolase [Halomonas sp. BBD45]MCP1364212.1 TatD family hydrolase [Halomonas sp. BBD48]